MTPATTERQKHKSGFRERAGRHTSGQGNSLEARRLPQPAEMKGICHAITGRGNRPSSGEIPEIILKVMLMSFRCLKQNLKYCLSLFFSVHRSQTKVLSCMSASVQPDKSGRKSE